MAIARVTNGSNIANGNATGPYTYTNQAFGSADLAFVLVFQQNINANDDTTGVTFNGNAMFRIAGTSGTGGNVFITLWAIGGTNAAGTHDVIVSWNGTHAVDIQWVTYSGTKLVSAATDIDSFGKTMSQSNSSPVSSFTTSLTTTADNCWTILFSYGSNSTSQSAGTGLTLIDEHGGFDYFVGDSNAAITPASAYTMGVNFTGNSRYVTLFCSFAPPSSGPANLKTWNGLAKASVKTINGVAIASVKTVNGLT